MDEHDQTLFEPPTPWPNQWPIPEGVTPDDEVSQDPNLVDDRHLDDEMED